MSEVLDVWTLTAIAVVLFFLGTPVVVVLATWGIVFQIAVNGDSIRVVEPGEASFSAAAAATCVRVHRVHPSPCSGHTTPHPKVFITRYLYKKVVILFPTGCFVSS